MDFLNTMTDAQFVFWYAVAVLAVTLAYGFVAVAIDHRNERRWKEKRRRVIFASRRVQ